MSISIVIPCFNSEKSLPELIERLNVSLGSMTKTYEVILVDDASKDNTWQVINTLAAKNQHVCGIQLMKNSGQANATLCGLEHVSFDTVITMDDDLQHPPDQILVLLKAFQAHPGIDCVFGVFKEKKHAAYRNFGSFLIKKMNQYAFKLPSSVQTSGFRVMTKCLARQITRQKSANPTLSVLILGITQKVISIPVVHDKRQNGRSNYTLSKQFRLAFDNICNSTMAPLRFVSAMGISICLISGILVIYYLILYFSGNVGIQGWTTLVILLSFFSGMILLSLGIIGEYLVRVLREVSAVSPYLIRKRHRIDSVSAR